MPKLGAMTPLDMLDRGMRRSHLSEAIRSRGDLLSRSGDIGKGVRYTRAASRTGQRALSDLSIGLGRRPAPAPRTILPHTPGHVRTSATPPTAVQALGKVAAHPADYGLARAARKMPDGALERVRTMVAPAATDKAFAAHARYPTARRDLVEQAKGQGVRLDTAARGIVRGMLKAQHGGAATAARNATVRNRVLMGLAGAAALGGVGYAADRAFRKKLPPTKAPLTSIDEAPAPYTEEGLTGVSSGYDPHVDAKHAAADVRHVEPLQFIGPVTDAKGDEAPQRLVRRPGDQKLIDQEKEIGALFGQLRAKGHRISTSDTREALSDADIGARVCHPAAPHRTGILLGTDSNIADVQWQDRAPGDVAVIEDGVYDLKRRDEVKTGSLYMDHSPDSPHIRTVKPRVPRIRMSQFGTTKPHVPGYNAPKVAGLQRALRVSRAATKAQGTVLRHSLGRMATVGRNLAETGQAAHIAPGIAETAARTRAAGLRQAATNAQAKFSRRISRYPGGAGAYQGARLVGEGMREVAQHGAKMATLMPADCAGFLRAGYEKIARDAIDRFIRAARTNGTMHTVGDLQNAWRLGAHTQPRTVGQRFATVGTRLKHLGGKSGPAWSSLKQNVQARLPLGTSIPGQAAADPIAKLKR